MHTTSAHIAENYNTKSVLSKAHSANKAQLEIDMASLLASQGALNDLSDKFEGRTPGECFRIS